MLLTFYKSVLLLNQSASVILRRTGDFPHQLPIKISQRYLRGSRFIQVSNPDENNPQEDNPPADKRRNDDKSRNPSQGERESDRDRDESAESSTVGPRPFLSRDDLTFAEYPEFGGNSSRRKNVRKLLKDSSTYGAPTATGGLGGDPFMTGPFVRGTKMSVYFDQGNDAAEESVRRKIDPKSTSIIMFPGQGTQYVGMSGDPTVMPRYIRVLYEIASEILQYDLLDLCINGPMDKLSQTVYSQPAILVASLAAMERLRDSQPDMIEKCVSVAGFSIGEISALVFAGVLSFEDAIRLVKVRAEAMQLTSEICGSGMATIIYGADSKLNYSLVVAKEWCRREYDIEEPVCSIANYLFPHCKVVAGHIEAIQFLENNYKDFNLRKVKRLPVSGAFHTDLMKPAAEPLKQLLRDMTINRPRMPVFSNVTGYRYHSSEEVRRNLPKQVYKPVVWEQIVQNIYKRPKDSEYPNSFECGPGASLSTVLKQVNLKAFKSSKVIGPFERTPRH